MLTKLSLWGIYFASYLVDYIMILIILIYKRITNCQGDSESFWNFTDLLVGGMLLAFIVASFIIISKVNNIKMNSRIKLIPERNITYEIAGQLLLQVVAVMSTLFTDWWIPINVVLFFVFGLFFTKANRVDLSPLFVIPLGNKIYSAGDSFIITRYSKQEMKIAQEDNLDGLEARELTEKVFYVK